MKKGELRLAGSAVREKAVRNDSQLDPAENHGRRLHRRTDFSMSAANRHGCRNWADAVITHLRAHDYSLGSATFFLLMAVAALVLRLATS